MIMTTINRPLSPHLQIYKPQLTSLLSIANGPEAYGNLQKYILAWYGQVFLFAWVFSLFYHLCNGIRHLFWDVGLGLEIRTTYISGYIVIAASILLTLVTWCLAGVSA